MKFEEFETAWAMQPATHPRAMDLTELKRSVIPALRRRSRMLGYGLFCVGFGLLASPLLAVVNYRYARPHNVVLFWVHLALFVAVYVPVLVYLVRRVQRHRQLRRQSADTLRALTAVSLANLESEIQEYRALQWLTPFVVGLPLLSAYVNHPVAAVGWQPFVLRAGLIVAFLMPVAWVIRRHYRQNLVPAYARQKEILRELS